jgi:hypothetical protein
LVTFSFYARHAIHSEYAHVNEAVDFRNFLKLQTK